ncbi:Putative zn(2)-C6 fungal-type DNA-binding domain-containing protein [Septoria linicola]|uniref:Zn(2)-C6 fungal-type DNA-binding domain-containing protein n=1 Tax=Septoria linicola TaxID=215465 RepID=A0A9Q9EFS3_9PEZI|nr:putative zn(2)-C6 fungal-type DNA-binding domain-containing protein [Septoria linicola]USW49260.1 Putative zn(2)-C6 fungal-type DNA-binding domain-containing protein [Septoria linicola]
MSGPGHSMPLLAARSSSGEASKDSNNSNNGNSAPTGPSRPPGGRPKRTLIESACSACRRRKSRCDGVRPSCSRCQNLRTECQYEAEEGESRWSALRRRNQILEHERDQIRELLAFVQTRPESEAMDIFQRIRTSSYDDIFLLLRQIRDGPYGIQPNLQQHIAHQGPTPPQAGAVIDHRLPPIQAILDVSSRTGLNSPGHAHHNGLPTHVNLVHSHSLSSDDSRTSSVPEYTPGPPPTLQPSLHQPLPQHAPHQSTHPPPLVGPKPSLSSEESTGSITSTTGYSMDPSKPYQTP